MKVFVVTCLHVNKQYLDLYQTHQMLHNYAHNSDCYPAAGSENERFAACFYELYDIAVQSYSRHRHNDEELAQGF